MHSCKYIFGRRDREDSAFLPVLCVWRRNPPADQPLIGCCDQPTLFLFRIPGGWQIVAHGSRRLLQNVNLRDRSNVPNVAVYSICLREHMLTMQRAVRGWIFDSRISAFQPRANTGQRSGGKSKLNFLSIHSGGCILLIITIKLSVFKQTSLPSLHAENRFFWWLDRHCRPHLRA